MKVISLALSAILSTAAAQNGNDPLILNNRTGLAPVVYDTFSTSHTAPTNEPARIDFLTTVPATLSPVRSNTFIHNSTTSIECWHNGYPCGQNGGQRSQRLVRNFVSAALGVAPRVPPPELFSTRTDVRLPSEIDVPAKTGDINMDIFPIPTEATDGKHYDAPPGKIGEAILSILPISTPTLPTTEGATIPTEWWRASSIPPGVAIPTEWWRGPAGSMPSVSSDVAIPTEWWRAPAQSSAAPNAAVILTKWWRGDMPSYTIKCARHYCPTPAHMKSRPTNDVPNLPIIGPSTLPVAQPTSTSVTSSHFAMPPEVIPRAMPIDWWRGPNHPVLPDVPGGIVGPIQRHSVSSPISSTSTKDPCYLHYCPSGFSIAAPATMGTSFKPTEPTVVTTSPVGTMPVVPPKVSIFVG